MITQTIRSLTITTLMRKLFSPTDPCQHQARFPRRTAKTTRIVEVETVQRKPCRTDRCTGKCQTCDDAEPKAWPYDTALPSGLPPIAEMPHPQPDVKPLHLRLHALNRPLPSDPLVDVMI